MYSVANALGVAKLLSYGALCEVEYFTAFDERDRMRMKIRRGDLRVAPIGRGTPCYWSENGRWRAGETVVVGQRRSRVATDGTETAVPVADLFVFSAVPMGPLELIRAKIWGAHSDYSLRHQWLAAAIEQRAAARGLDGVASSSVNLHPHQLEVARRVLLDPIQRYLLGDEVGLGKTIEAGLVIRQLLVNCPGARVVVLVPSSLVGQWAAELADKFHTAQFPEAEVRIHPYNPRQAWQDEDDIDLLVVDEAHRVTADPTAPAFNAVGALAKRTPRLLMLSATPALTNQRAYLGLLHLLDPDVYSLDDTSGFRQRVTLRAEIAQMMLTFKPSLPNFHLRRVARRLIEQFPNDQRLGVLANRLLDDIDQSVTSDADFADRERAVLAVRTHVEETYRLHRRLLRTRRSTATELGVVIRGRGRPTEYESAPHEALLQINDLLDAWRETLAGTARATDSITIASQLPPMVYARAGSDPQVLKDIVQLRLGRKRDGRSAGIPKATAKSINDFPLGEAEKDVLRELVELLEWLPEPVVLARASAVGDAIERSPSQKTVVFASFEVTAARVAGYLRAALGNHRVVQLAPSASPENATATVSLFRNERRCEVLVASPIASEGFNLQFVDQVIHADLPWAPNVVEQRIGRVDRYGRLRPFATAVIVDGELNSYSDAWYRCLRDGFGVFDRSIAGLQMVIPSVMQTIRQALLLEGLDGFEQETAELPAKLALELAEIEERESLDSIEAAGTTRDYLAGLVRADEQAGKLRHALSLGAWLGQAEFRPADDRDRFKLDFASESPDCPELTVNRDIAVGDPRAELLRPGHPTFERFDRAARAAASARTYAVRAVSPGLQHDEELFWCVDLVIGPGEPSVMSGELDDYRFWHETVSARARWYLPPRLFTVVLDSTLEPVHDHLELLNAATGGREIEFARDDWPLHEFLQEDDWAAQCAAAAVAAGEHVLRTETVRERIEGATKAAERDSTEAQQQADARQAADVLAALDGLPEELELRRAVIESIQLAKAEVDAIGIIIATSPDVGRP